MANRPSSPEGNIGRTSEIQTSERRESCGIRDFWRYWCGCSTTNENYEALPSTEEIVTQEPPPPGRTQGIITAEQPLLRKEHMRFPGQDNPVITQKDQSGHQSPSGEPQSGPSRTREPEASVSPLSQEVQSATQQNIDSGGSGQLPAKRRTHVSRFHDKLQEQEETMDEILGRISSKMNSVSRELGLGSSMKEQQIAEEKKELRLLVSQTETNLRKLAEAYNKKQLNAFTGYYEEENNIRSIAQDMVEDDEEIYNNFLKVSKENEKKFSLLNKNIDELKEKQKEYAEEISAYLGGKESILRKKEAGIYSIRKKQILLELLVHRRIIKAIDESKEAMKKVIPEEHEDPSG